MSKKQKWFLVGLVSMLLAAPNATVIKYTLGESSPYLFNTLRFFIVAFATTPFFVKAFSKFTKTNVVYTLNAGIFMSIAVVSYVLAIKQSQASYVSIITLVTPITFIFYSLKLTGDRITSRAITGITLAAIGAMIIVLLPVALHQDGNFVFYPIATFYGLINSLSFPLAIIYYKKANESGVPMGALMSGSAWIICVVNVLMLLFFVHTPIALNQKLGFGVLYSGLAVALLARALNVISYEHLGAVITSALGYLETFFAVLIPLLLLHEKISVEMVIGGVLILCGVYVAEHHKSTHHKHFHIFRSH